MDDKSLWFGFGAGMCASVLVLTLVVINNDYVKSIHNNGLYTMNTLGLAPTEISLSIGAAIIFCTGIIIAIVCWILQTRTLDTEGV